MSKVRLTGITQKELHSLLHYDPLTGVFTRIKNRRRARIGDTAGSPDADGYLRISIKNISYKAHRLAWLYVYGEWPKGEIDHENTIKADNHIANLRDATTGQNQQNRPSAKGFRRKRKRWGARITVDGVEKSLGGFATASEARAAYLAAKRLYHPFRPLDRLSHPPTSPLQPAAASVL